MAIDFAVSADQAFFEAAPANGSLGPGEALEVTASLTAAAAGLGDGVYNGTLGFTNESNGMGDTARAVELTVDSVPATMVVTPETGLSSSGTVGGPFDPAQAVYIVRNSGDETLEFTATGDRPFFEVTTCSFTLLDIQGLTSEMIAEFLSRRMDLILTRLPDGRAQIDRLIRWRDRAQQQAAGPLDFSLESRGGVTGSLSTSLSRIRAYQASLAGPQEAQSGPRQEMQAPPAARFDIWLEAEGAVFDASAGREGSFAIGHIGADYILSDDLLLGVMASFDHMEQDGRLAGSSIEGEGWMAGPYLTYRLSEHLFFYGHTAWGQSYNEISPLGTYRDAFDTDRWLARGRLTGAWQQGAWRFTPALALSYMREDQKAYRDSLGNVIPSQSVALGQLTLDPQVSYLFRGEDGTLFEPGLSLQGVWTFHQDRGLAGRRGPDGVDPLRARLELGLDLLLPSGVRFGLSGNYDGLGAEDYDALGGELRIDIPLN